MSLRRTLSANRWPIFLSGLLAMPIVACAVLIYVATRPAAPRPIPRFYEAAASWDADEAVLAASRELGWNATYEVPAGVPHVGGMPRPVDVRVVDREGAGVTGLEGRLVVARASDQRLSQAARLVGLPHAAGSYRALMHVDQPGFWDFRLEVSKGALRFVHEARVSVASDPSAAEGVK